MRYYWRPHRCLSTSNAWIEFAELVVDGTPVETTPFYSPVASTLGGGFLGVLPYGLYESMCTPVDGASGSITSSAFNREDDNCEEDTPIALHFYGPIHIWNPAVPAVKVEYLPGSGSVDMSLRVTYRINPTNPRELLIEGKPGYPIPYGNYRVTNSTSLYQALYCTPISGVGAPCVTGARW